MNDFQLKTLKKSHELRTLLTLTLTEVCVDSWENKRLPLLL